LLENRKKYIKLLASGARLEDFPLDLHLPETAGALFCICLLL